MYDGTQTLYWVPLLCPKKNQKSMVYKCSRCDYIFGDFRTSFDRFCVSPVFPGPFSSHPLWPLGREDHGPTAKPPGHPLMQPDSC